MRYCLALLLVVSGCGDSEECDSLEKEIRETAIQRGYDSNSDGRPDATADKVCADKNAAIQRDFGAACAKYRSCQ
jgi:hypothetical protein